MMADLIVRPDLAEKLRQVAEREHRSVDDVLESLLADHTPPDDAELEDELDDDFDDDAKLKPEVVEELQQVLKERPRGKPVDQIVKELGLDD